MIRTIVAAALGVWAGATLVLSELPWFRIRALTERLRPYAPGGLDRPRRVGAFSAASIRDVVGPLAIGAGNQLARLAGINDDLAARLERTEATADVNAFRLRQAGWALAALTLTALLCSAVGPPVIVSTLLVLGAPALAFLVLEHQLSEASASWQRRVTLELPVVIEQLGMLLSAGYSLTAAVHRLGQRNRGMCALEFVRIGGRIRQGIAEIDALREWAARCDVPAIDRLVGVLALNWEAGDLGDLIAAEARAVRREVQRGEIELIERRAQQVWIPVTVATLLPGVVFMAVPFIDAMSKLTGR